MDPRRCPVSHDGPIYGHEAIHAATRTLRIWLDEFEQAHREHGLFQLTLHPHVIGHRSRIIVLEQLLEHISSISGVFFARHDEVAAYLAGLDPGATRRGSDMSGSETAAS